MANITERHTTADQLSAIAVCKSAIIPDSYLWQYQEITDSATPYCDVKNKKICAPLFSSNMPQKDYEIVAGKIFHESAHAAYTTNETPSHDSAIMHKVLNHLEDRRIEWIISKGNGYISRCLGTLNEWGANSVNTGISENHDKVKPVDEALYAMNLTDNGHAVLWQMSDMAKAMFDKAMPVFSTWRNIDDVDKKAGFKNLFPIAEEIIRIFNEVVEEQQHEFGENSDSDKNNSGEQEKGNGEQEKGNGEQENGNGEKEKGDGEQEKGNDEQEKGDGKQEKGDGEQEKDDDEQENGGGQEKGDGKQEKGDGEQKEKTDNTFDGEENGEAEKSDFNNSGKKYGGSKIKSLDDLADKEDFLKRAIEEKMKEIKADSDNTVGEYKAYTAEDKIAVAEQNPNRYQEAKDAIGGYISSMSRHFRQVLQTMSAKHNLTMRDRGNIDMQRLPQAATGISNRVFYKEVEGQIDLDVAVTILVDESGSMGNIILEVRQLAIAFAESFDKLNIKFEVLGFSTNSTYISYKGGKKYSRQDALMIYEYKTFADRFQAVKTRMGSMTARENNVDGESLQVAYRRNANQKAKRHIVLVLSDGQPAACGDKDKLCRHLKKVVSDIRKAGGEVYAFGLCTEEPEQFYSKEFFVYLKSIQELGPAFLKKVSDILINGRKKVCNS